MIIESDTPISPPPTQGVKITVSHQEHTASAVLEIDGTTRDRLTGDGRIKCYDARAAIIWIDLPQFVIEELLFGEIL